MNGVNGNQLYYPFGMFVDSSNSLYIADWHNNRIQKWVSGALTGTTVAGQPNGTAGSNSSYFTGRSNLFVDSSGNMYITDTGNVRVQLWASSATSGTTIAGITGKQAKFLSNSSLCLYIPNTLSLNFIERSEE